MISKLFYVFFFRLYRGVICSERLRGKVFFLLWLHLVSCGILAPQPGLKPQTPAVEMQTQPLDHLESLWGNLLIYQVL